MKRKFTLLIAAFALLTMIVQPGKAWGQSEVTWTASEQGYENAGAVTDFTIDDHITGVFDIGSGTNAPKYYNTGTGVRTYGGNTITINASRATMTRIEFTYTQKSKAVTADDGEFDDSNPGVWTGINGTSVTFSVETGSGHNRVSSIKVTYVPAGGGDTPSISASNVNIAYDATSGEIEYTINNPAQDGNLTADLAQCTWIQNADVDDDKVTIYCDSNQNASARTDVVTLVYTYNTTETVTKNVSVTQAGNPDVYMTISEVRAQGTGSVVTKGIVTSCAGTTGYIQDNDAAICVYGTSSLTVGDEIIVSGTLSTYNGLLEITSPQVSVLSSGNTVNPELMTVAEAAASTNQGWYIRIENALVTAINDKNVTIHEDESSIVVRFNNANDISFAVNDIINLDGNIGYYNGNQIANPQNVEVQHVFIPTIIFEQDVFNLGAEQILVQQIPFNFENFEVENYESFAIQFYDVTGALAEKPEWITGAGVTGTNDTGYKVTLTVISANQGDARSTYFKVYAMVDNEAVYSNIVTINQAEYVAPTYAVLPFSFDGGRNDIANTDGLYQEGLGSDYNTSPKLKFDGDGDWLRLQFNEEPGKLTFDIKGNGSGSTPWAGTFILQTSADGETYTDHATYTELPGTKETFTITNLGSDVRYIQWIYTEKTVGNVALGNINLTQPYTPEAYDLTVEPYENLELFVFIGGDESEMALEGAGTIQVNEGDNVMLSITADEGYEISSLMVDGEEHVNDISDDYTYSFIMPSHNVTISATAVAVTPFEPTTYTLATSIESGKTYIIVGNKTIEQETSYYAMGEQKTNNRTGVAISVDGNTATVDTDKVYELVIEGPDEDGLYTIYDSRTPGYLYAASSSANNLKTQEENDDNGRWAITFNEEGYAEVIATESSNRNDIRFNYNNGSPLFSCYDATTTTQAHVYIYVKEEGISTQTLALAAGTNWVSFNVETNIDDLKAALVAALPGTNITIQSQTQKATYNGSRWTGRLTSIDVANMYKIKVTAACELTLQGEKVNPAELPLTIIPGVNWIAYELEEANAPETVFAGFAVPGDYVKSQTQKKSYNGSRWTGRLNSLEPGQGYIYNSASSETRTFTYPTSGSKGATSNK
jgi:hypothetical protein